MKKIALITGATAGIGEATAQLFAEHGYNLIITGRRSDRLDQLAKQLQAAHGTTVLSLTFDVRDSAAVEANLGNLPAEWQTIDVLVNNAGLASGISSIEDGSLDDWERMIDTNFKGLLYVSKAIIPYLKERKRGHIVNIGSIAGKETYRNGNVYCATKHAVDSLTKAMRIDLLPYQIKVTGVCPGAVETEFSIVRLHGDVEKAKSVYNGFEPLKAMDIAEVIYFTASRPAHVNINDVLVMPTAQANSSTIFRHGATENKKR